MNLFVKFKRPIVEAKTNGGPLETQDLVLKGQPFKVEIRCGDRIHTKLLMADSTLEFHSVQLRWNPTLKKFEGTIQEAIPNQLLGKAEDWLELPLQQSEDDLYTLTKC